MSLFDALMRWSLPLVPRFLVRRVARPYVAGETLGDAVRVVRQLNEQGAMATLDFLGEEARDTAVVERAVAEYERALEVICAESLRCNISVKPSQMGLHLDPERCRGSVSRLARRAAELGNFVRLDMEDHRTTDATLAHYRQLRPEAGNLGVVLQSMLRRTQDDIGQLLPLGPNVRLVKGIYREPRAVAYQAFETVRAAYVRALERLLGEGAYTAIATHDEHLVCEALALIARLGIPREGYEFQMLLGVEPELRSILLAGGHRLRVYVPYGHDWYAYSLRRLRENPTVAWHILRSLLSR